MSNGQISFFLQPLHTNGNLSFLLHLNIILEGHQFIVLHLTHLFLHPTFLQLPFLWQFFLLAQSTQNDVSSIFPFFRTLLFFISLDTFVGSKLTNSPISFAVQLFSKQFTITSLFDLSKCFPNGFPIFIILQFNMGGTFIILNAVYNENCSFLNLLQFKA